MPENQSVRRIFLGAIFFFFLTKKKQTTKSWVIEHIRLLKSGSSHVASLRSTAACGSRHVYRKTWPQSAAAPASLNGGRKKKKKPSQLLGDAAIT